MQSSLELAELEYFENEMIAELLTSSEEEEKSWSSEDESWRSGAAFTCTLF